MEERRRRGRCREKRMRKGGEEGGERSEGRMGWIKKRETGSDTDRLTDRQKH